MRNLTERLATTRQKPDDSAIPAWTLIGALAVVLALAIAAALVVRRRRSRGKVSEIIQESIDPSLPFLREKEDALPRS